MCWQGLYEGSGKLIRGENSFFSEKSKYKVAQIHFLGQMMFLMSLILDKKQVILEDYNVCADRAEIMSLCGMCSVLQ